MSKTAVIDLQSYGLFGIWTTLRESTDWCLWFSFFKYMRYEDHYRIICLSPHCKINYCILTSGNCGLFVKIPSFSHKRMLHLYTEQATPQLSFPPTALQHPNLHSLLPVSPRNTAVSPDWGDLKISIQGAALLKEESYLQFG